MIDFIEKTCKLVPTAKTRAFVLAPDIIHEITKDRHSSEVADLIKFGQKFIDYQSQLFKCEFCTSLIGNYHHLTTRFCWEFMLRDLVKILDIKDFNPLDFKPVNFSYKGNDLTFHEKKNDQSVFEFSSFTRGIKTAGSHFRCVRGLTTYVHDMVYTPYHQLFAGSHQFCLVKNSASANGRRLAVMSDSMSIPVIPILAYYFDSILYIDNRYPIHESIKNMTSYTNEISKFNATDFISILQFSRYYDETLWKNIW